MIKTQEREELFVLKKGNGRKAAWMLESFGQILSEFDQKSGENNQKKYAFLVVLGKKQIDLFAIFGQSIVRIEPKKG